MNIRLIWAAAVLISPAGWAGAQTPTTSPAAAELHYVVIVSRHGVRSPTGKPDRMNMYSAQPWPKWDVPPGYLTEHGGQLMTLFGTYDRALLAQEGLLAANGCADASRVSVYADSDQRTRETGKALAAGMFPQCSVDLHALPEGTPDPLFHPLEAGGNNLDKGWALAAVSGRIGGNPAGLTEAWRPQLEAMEDVLLGCPLGTPCTPSGAAPPASLFDIPASIGEGKTDHLVDLRSPLGPASTMAEDFLLEYTDGMDKEQVGWGRVDEKTLRELLQIHTGEADVMERTPFIARAQASNLLSRIVQSMQQSVEGKPVTGALGKPDDRVLVLVGHDSNLASISGTLGLSWLIDGRRDDTPPGGALVLELWKSRSSGEYFVRTFYTAQTLNQMRNSTPLSLAAPPDRAPVFVPGCGRADGSCTWLSFRETLQTATQHEVAE
ncbi:MAG: histidine-type phosphatase [Acidobacteriaceae bacterium]